MIDESELDILELDELAEDGDAFSIGRLTSVALGGALISLAAYYLYHQLDPEKREKLKRQASGMIAEQIHALTDMREEH